MTLNLRELLEYFLALEMFWNSLSTTDMKTSQYSVRKNVQWLFQCIASIKISQLVNTSLPAGQFSERNFVYKVSNYNSMPISQNDK